MKFTQKLILSALMCASGAGCSSLGTIVYEDSIIHGPTAFLAKQEVGSWSVTTPDGITATANAVDQDATAVVSAYGFVKGAKVVENVLGDGVSDILTSGGEALKGD